MVNPKCNANVAIKELASGTRGVNRVGLVRPGPCPTRIFRAKSPARFIHPGAGWTSLSPVRGPARPLARARPEPKDRGPSSKTEAEPEGRARDRRPKAEPEIEARDQSSRLKPETEAEARSPMSKLEPEARSPSPRLACRPVR